MVEQSFHDGKKIKTVCNCNALLSYPSVCLIYVCTLLTYCINALISTGHT